MYAVKANCNRLLDVARETYKENVGDIFALCRTLSEQHELPLQLVYQESAGGFVFALKKADLGDGTELPRGFLNVSSSKGRIVFSTLELVSDVTNLCSTCRGELTAVAAKAECEDEGRSG